MTETPQPGPHLFGVILSVLPVPGHCLANPIGKMGARLVAEPGPGFFDAVVEIEPEELEPCLREPRRLGRAATAGAAFHGPGRDPRQPERHRTRRSGRTGTIGDGVDELAFGDNLPVREV